MTMLGVHLGIGSGAGSSNIFDFAADPPSPLAGAFLTWVGARISARDSELSTGRATTYYFSQSGDDGTGDGSQGSPYKTLSKADSLLASGDVRFLFNRGDVWQEAATISNGDSDGGFTGAAAILIDQPNVTIDAYGSGANPMFECGATDYSSGSDWTLESGTTHEMDETTEMSWLAQADRDDPLSRQTSLANVNSTSNSWAWIADKLYVNLGGTDPDTVTLTAVPRNMHSCFRVQDADGVRIENVDTFGWGMNANDPNSHHYGISVWVTGTKRAVVKGCVCKYGATHVAATWNGSGSGGSVLWRNCTFAWPIPSSGARGYNAYQPGGGLETILDNITFAFGELPEVATTGGGESFGGHTTGGDILGLTIFNNCTVNAGTHAFTGLGMNSLANTVATSTLADCRTFIIGETHTGAITGKFFLVRNGVAIINCDWNLKTNLNSPWLYAFPTELKGWMWNNQITADFTDAGLTQQFRGLAYSSPTTDSSTEFYHNHIHYILRDQGANGTDAGFEQIIVASASAAAGNIVTFNNIISATLVDEENEQARMATGNVAARMDSNAYWQITQGTLQQKYDNDAGAVELGSLPVLGAAPVAAMQNAGNALVGLAYDANGAVRSLTTPSIGPIE